MTIHELSRDGESIRAVSQETGHARNTVKKVLRGEHSTERKPTARQSKLDPYKEYASKRYHEQGLSAVRILEELRPQGYDGSIQTLRRYLHTLRAGGVHKKATVRFETPPGKQAQADWAACGRFPGADGKLIPVHAFVMVLGYSRKLFVYFTTSMKMSALIRCHQLAFDYFGGWPQVMLYDNMKQVRISRTKWNEQFLDFANHYGFTPKTHRPYRPRTKGKVERAVDYVKGNFLQGREFHGLDDLNAQVAHWLENTANVRVHGTTKKRPNDLFVDETLTSVTSVSAYRYATRVPRKVSFESMVHFEGSRYSVPPVNAGKKVLVTAQGGHISVTLDDAIIAEHRQAARAGQCIVEKEHIAELWRITNEQVPAPAERSWEVHFDERVETLPLTRFEEVVQ